MANDDLFKGVGEHSKVDYVAVQTAFGMMIPATRIFEKLGYVIDAKRTIAGDWEVARFLTKKGSIPIQLIDSFSKAKIIAGENHIAIMVDDPQEVALEIFVWASRGDFDVFREEVSEGRWFVTIPAIFTQPIELVLSHPRIRCPECNGAGEIVRGHEGKGYTYVCDTCKGKKSIPLIIEDQFLK